MRRNKKRLDNLYKSEEELCNVLIEYAQNNGWEVYCETSGWDLLLVKNNVQIGVQAKIRDSIEVLYQASKYNCGNEQPHIRAVLVPQASFEFSMVALEMGIFVIEALNQSYPRRYKHEIIKKINIDLDKIPAKLHNIPKKLCWVPEINVKVAAGVPSPKKITKWKIGAVKLCLLLNKNGYLTATDFKAEKIHIGLWIKKKWLIADRKIKGLTKYVRNSNIELPDQKYPEIVEALKEKEEKK